MCTHILLPKWYGYQVEQHVFHKMFLFDEGIYAHPFISSFPAKPWIKQIYLLYNWRERPEHIMLAAIWQISTPTVAHHNKLRFLSCNGLLIMVCEAPVVSLCHRITLDSQSIVKDDISSCGLQRAIPPQDTLTGFNTTLCCHLSFLSHNWIFFFLTKP